MIRFAMSCASSLAVDVVAAFEPLADDNAVSGLSSRIEPMRRTISGHEIVGMSAWLWRRMSDNQIRARIRTNIWYTEQMCVEVVHIYEPYYSEYERDYLPDVECGKEQKEQQGEAREPDSIR